jgi:hypothetical protein
MDEPVIVSGSKRASYNFRRSTMRTGHGERLHAIW